MEEIVKEAEVVIIGGGVIGTSIAYWLAKKAKKDVVLIEKKEIASESSGSSLSTIRTVRLPPHPNLAKLCYRTLQGIHQLSRETGRDFEFVSNRCVMIEEEDSIKRYEGYYELLVEMGFSGMRVASGNEFAELEPYLKPSLGAWLDEGGGIINSLCYVTTLADVARKLGVKIYERTRVLDISERRGHVESVVTDRGEVKCEYIVNAAGSWAPQIGEMIGLRIPISLYLVQVVVTEELPVRLLRGAGTSLSSYFSEKAGGQACFFTVRQMRKGEVQIGLTETPVASPDKGKETNKWTDFDSIQAMCRSAIEYMPILKEMNVHIIRSFANLYNYTPDGLPILGKVEGHEGLIMACGFNDCGIMHSYGTGEIIAELICFDETSVPLDDFSLSRFG